MTSGFTTMRNAFGLAYFPVSALARLPLSMLVLGVLTFVVHTTGQLSAGGAVSAIAGVGVAIGAPLSGAASDRWGQRVTLLTGAIAYGLALLWLLAVGSTATTFGPALAAAAFLAGLVVPQCGPMTRVRWIKRLGGTDPAALDTAQSYESTLDELSFVFGPAAVGVIAVAAGPAAPLWVALTLTVVFVPWFALHRSGDASRTRGAGHSPDAAEADGVVPWALITVLMLGMLSIGTIFGSLATTTTAFVVEAGQPDSAGLVYATLGITSGLGALSVARWPRAWTAARRWVCCSALLVPVLALLWLAAAPWQLSLLLLLVGAPIGPVLVTVFSAAGLTTPTRRLGLVMTLLSAAVTLGTSIGNWLGGALAEVGGHQASLGVTFAAGVALLVFGLLYAARESVARPQHLQRAEDRA